MKLWIDDYRDAPDDSWTEVRKVEPAIRLLATQMLKIKEISIDHDIENRPDDETFKPIAYVIGILYEGGADEEFTEPGVLHTMWRKKWRPKVTVHSDNPVGAKEIVAILGDYGLKSEWHPFTSEESFKAKFGLN